MKQVGGLPGKNPHVAGAAPRRVFLFRVNPERHFKKEIREFIAQNQEY